ncbi:MAG: thiamine phosphate synthase [Gemmatimonadetes bacterium]|nr:thiamine phosphate synthase [Gemmatimonadota bacterium]
MDLRLLAIIDLAVLGGRDLVAAARLAEAGGATALQLRMKGASAAGLYSATRRLLDALSIPVYVNDRADVAWAARAHGVHLGQDDVPAGPTRAILPASLRIGLSVGSPPEAEIARRAAVDYWSIGPLYRTASKADAGVALGPAGFSRLAALAPAGVPVIAIGGITASNAGEVIRAGAAGVAVISAIFGAPDVSGAARAIRAAVDAALDSRPAPPGSRPDAR